MHEIDFHRSFHPLTSHPFDREDCGETPPCSALRPYVRCFWGPVAQKPCLVVPDACADIIIRMDDGRIHMAFCPVDNTPYMTGWQHSCMFGVRFYFWALPWWTDGPFSEEAFPDLRGYLTREGFVEADHARRIRLMEAYLLRRMEKARVEGALLDGVDCLLRSHGRVQAREAAAHAAVSLRTLERMFRVRLGLSPKEAAEVIRYQTLWRRSLAPEGFDVQEQVEALGFCDQAHLLNTFRRYHGLPLREAVARAKNVAFFQDSGTGL